MRARSHFILKKIKPLIVRESSFGISCLVSMNGSVSEQVLEISFRYVINSLHEIEPDAFKCFLQ